MKTIKITEPLQFFPKHILGQKKTEALIINPEGHRLPNDLHTIPAEIAQLKNLKQLEIIRSNITVLAPGFENLAQLELLDLSHNPLQAIPNSFEQLTNLRIIRLADCLLPDFPGQILKAPKLEEIDLNYNQFASIPSQLNQLRKLKCLKLCGLIQTDEKIYEQFAEMEAGELFNTLFSIDMLSELELRNCGISVLPEIRNTGGKKVKIDLRNNRISQIHESWKQEGLGLIL